MERDKAMKIYNQIEFQLDKLKFSDSVEISLWIKIPIYLSTSIYELSPRQNARWQHYVG